MTSAFATLAQAAKDGASFDDLQDNFNRIDFLSFSITEIKEVEDAPWIPAEVKAAKLRQWIRTQDAIIAQIQGYLALRATLSKEDVQLVARAIGNPSSAGESFVVENLFERIATGGGTRAFINPALNKLITVEVDDKGANEPLPDSESGVYKVFDGNPSTSYLSASIPKRWIKITLPPFLKLELTSYTLASPVKGMVSWVLQRGLDGRDSWEDIHSVSNSTAFTEAGGRATFKIDAQGYGRVFRLMQLSENAQQNHSIYLGSIEFTGRALIEN